MFKSPLDQFEIKPIIILNNTNIISNYSIYLILISIIIGLYIYFIKRNNYIIPSKYNIIILSIYDTILNMVKTQIGNKGYKYFPLIFTLFNIIFIGNIISMVPYSFAISAQLSSIIFLSITLWISITIIGLYNHGLYFFNLFVPVGTPLPLIPVLVIIELLSYTSRAISLGLRLSANILSGHLLMFILATLILNLMSISFLTFFGGIIPILGVIAITILEFAISIIQSYVFCILFSGYLKDAIYLH